MGGKLFFSLLLFALGGSTYYAGQFAEHNLGEIDLGWALLDTAFLTSLGSIAFSLAGAYEALLFLSRRK